MSFIFFLAIFFSSFLYVSETDEMLTVSANQNWNFKPSMETISSDELKFLNVTHNKELFNSSAGSDKVELIVIANNEIPLGIFTYKKGFKKNIIFSVYKYSIC